MSRIASPALEFDSPPFCQINGSPGFTGATRCPEIDAMIRNPRAPHVLDAFLRLLGRLDPEASRSDDLTDALIAALAVPNVEVWEAQVFAQRSILHEVNAGFASQDDVIDFPPATLSLITTLLHHRLITFLLLEDVLTALRHGLLIGAEKRQMPCADKIALAEAFARHSFTNEYIWEEQETETVQVDALIGNLSGKIENGDAVPAFELFVVGAYRALDEIPTIRNWVLDIGSRDLTTVDPTLRMLVFDRLIEDALEVEELTPLSSGISAKVQAQYEENPYPRWRHLHKPKQFDALTSYVIDGLGGRATVPPHNPQRPVVLIAGAGTGLQPINVAQALPHAAVLAVDLSRRSLAYATREAHVRGIDNVAFAQGDILKLSDVDLACDLIECTGVLHHLEDPELGLKTLTNILKPGGFLKLGLYSKVARQDVNAARQCAAKGAYETGRNGIRCLRRDLINSDDPNTAPLFQHRDFYTTSEFRDLVLHVQEHQFTLPQIERLLKRNGLEFLGFTNPEAIAVLNELPAKKARSLKTWSEYEERYSDTFRCMYNFICVKR